MDERSYIVTIEWADGGLVCLETDSLHRQDIMKKYLLVVLGAMVWRLAVTIPIKIGRASTVFHMLGKNDRIEVEGFDDPDVQGVACYISYAKKAV